MEASNTEIGTETATEGDLLALAMKADSTEEIVVGEESDAQTSSVTQAEESQAEEKSSKDTDPNQGPETKQAEKQDEQSSEQEESKYAKARKEEERRDRSWKKLEEEKAALRAEREQYEQDRSRIATEKAKAKEYRDSNGYTAEDYEKFSKETDDPSLAEEAAKRAEALKAEASEARNKVAQEDFIKGWKENLDDLLAKDPELKNEESDIGRDLKRVLAERSIFSTSPDGIKHAYEFAKAMQSASLVSGLRSQVEKLTSENERLNKLTAVSGSGPNQKPSPKTLLEMTASDQDAFLERLANEADGSSN
jgi:chromosome segregation ATPase